MIIPQNKTCCPWNHGLRPKKRRAPALVWVPSQRPLDPSVTSVANDRVIMKLCRELCTDILAFALKLRKTSARTPSNEGVMRPVIASNGVPFLQMRSVESYSTSGREKEVWGIGSWFYIKDIDTNL